jgi:hypothetical protein
MREAAVWHWWLTQITRAKKLRSAQTSLGLGDSTARSSVRSDAGAAACIGFAARGRFGGPARCTGKSAVSGLAVATIASGVGSATGGDAGVT